MRLAREFHLAQEFYWYNPAKLPTPAEWVTIRRIRVKDAVDARVLANLLRINLARAAS